MSKYEKLNHRFGIMEFPLTLSELKGVILEFPKTERIYYDYSIKAMKPYLKEDENIYYLTVGGAKLLKPSGFVVVAESGLVFTWLKGGLTGGAKAEKVDYDSIKKVDYDIIPGGSSAYGGGTLILEVEKDATTKKRTIRDIEEQHIDTLVESIKIQTRLSTLSDVERFFGSQATNEEKKIIRSFPLAVRDIRKNYLDRKETILHTIPVSYETPKNKKVKGLLVATDQKIIFLSESIFKKFVEIHEYEIIREISQSENKILISSDESDLTVELIESDSEAGEYLRDLWDAALNPYTEEETAVFINNSGDKQEYESSSNTDKYQQLKQLGELKDQGILTDEEFQAEKQKVLNQ